MKKLLNKLTAFTVITSNVAFIVGCKEQDIEKSRNNKNNKNKENSDPQLSLESNPLTKVKEYIENNLHVYSNFDEYAILEPEMLF